MPTASKVSVELGRNVKVVVNDVGIEAGPSTYLLNRPEGQRQYTAENAPGSKNRIVLLGVNQGIEAEPAYVDLAMEFEDFGQAVAFIIDLRAAHYTTPSEQK